jgi:hypothetical protein
VHGRDGRLRGALARPSDCVRVGRRRELT